MATAEQARALLAPHGKLRPQSGDEWTGTVPLPKGLERFYFEVGPGDLFVECYGNPFILSSLASLWEFQAGYRWDGSTGERNKGWEDDWFAVASDGGAVYLYDAESDQVLFNHHACGYWAPVPIFTDLNTMGACFGYLGTATARPDQEYLNEDSTVRADFLIETVEGLRSLLGSGPSSKEVLKLIGWV